MNRGRYGHSRDMRLEANSHRDVNEQDDIEDDEDMGWLGR